MDTAMALQPTTTTEASASASVITFLTDVEGDGAYFDRFIRHSKILKFRSIHPCFGRYARASGGKANTRSNRVVSSRSDDHNSGTEWNLGEWEEGYFPYDKEVIFREDGDDDDDEVRDAGRSRNNSMLVYGGDIWDKGGSDLYVLRQLLSLHGRYPNRVHFLMGNRDINKMRIVDELGMGNIHNQNKSMPNHGGVYWLRRDRGGGSGSGGGSDGSAAVCSGLPVPPADPSLESIVVPPSDTASERLKWMLQRTMGSVDAFELRRKELERERVAIRNMTSVCLPSVDAAAAERDANGRDKIEVVAPVTDDEVAQSYIRSCNPTSGVMGQYLTHAKLVIRFGSVLFFHGAFPFASSSSSDDNDADDDNDEQSSPDFPTPWMHTGDENGTVNTGCNSLTEWIDVLNDFASNKVKAWKEYNRQPRLQEEYSSSLDSSSDVWATEGGYHNNSTAGGIAFGALLQYGMGTLPDRSRTLSCVYNSWMHDGLPREDMFGCDDSTRRMSELFTREGIQIILTGHQPVGDAPWPIRMPQQNNGEKSKLCTILPCDTSFSGDTCWTRLEGFDSSESLSLGRGLLASGRGEVAFSEPLIYLNQATQSVDSVNLHGCLSDGVYYDTGNIIDAHDKDHLVLGEKLGQTAFTDKDSGDSKMGMFWVKGKVGKSHLVSYGEGFNVWNSYIKSV